MPKNPTNAGPIDLFGNPQISPRQLMQRQLAELLQETSARTVNADPRTQGVSLFGSAVGGLAGQALIKAGVLPKPPELERAEKLESARAEIKKNAEAQGIDPVKDPGAFADLAASHFLRAGDEQSAMMAMQWRQLREAQGRQAEKERQGISTARSQEIQNLKGYTPASIQKFRETGDASALEIDPQAAAQGRSAYFTPIQTAGGIVVFDNRSGRFFDANGKQITQPVVGSTSDPRLQGDIAGAKEGGKKKAGATFDLPTAEANAARAITAIDEAVADPALKSATGPIAGRFPALFGDQARGVARIEQLKGGAFLAAYQELKGGGHITEIEGEKAQQAIARLNRAQSYDDYIAALKDLRAIIVRGREVARQKAGVKSSAQETAPSGSQRSRKDILKQYGL